MLTSHIAMASAELFSRWHLLEFLRLRDIKYRAAPEMEFVRLLVCLGAGLAQRDPDRGPVLAFPDRSPVPDPLIESSSLNLARTSALLSYFYLTEHEVILKNAYVRRKR